MTAHPDSVRARRYLLGQASEDECAVIEREYLQQDEAIDRIAAVEDDLIEDYLSDELSLEDRGRFERTYLSAPHHRVRVETIRRLRALSSSSGSTQPVKPSGAVRRAVSRPGPWLALAASVLIAASVSFWARSSSPRREAGVAVNRTPAAPASAAPGQTTPSRTAPQVFAVTISPMAVRSAGESTSAIVPAGTEIVAFQLERDVDGRRLTATRASIRTVDGKEAWRGPAVLDGTAAAGIAARLEVPAASLPSNDYLVTLYGADRAGAEQEWTDYFVRLRMRR